MFRLDQFSISRRIAMIAGMPFLAALAFGAYIIFQDGIELTETRNLARTVDVGPMLGAFVHEAQIERGLTASVLKNRDDAAIAAKRRTQIERTDAAKTLAGQASRATDEIAEQIGGIQRATQATVDDIRRIARSVEEVDQLTSAVSNSVEQQTVATEEIAHAISSASESTTRSSASVAQMSEIVSETTREAERVSTATGLINQSSRKLNAALEEFLAAMAQDVKDRRFAVRKSSTQGVLISAAGGATKTRLVDISDTGARVVASPELHDGDRLELEFEDRSRIPAQVVWLRDGFAGLQFSAPIAAAIDRYAA